MKKILITGAGTGFGKLFSLELAKRGYHVIAAVELPSQMWPLRQEAQSNNVHLEVIKCDVTDANDISYAVKHNADILVNNAGIGEGGALLDMPDRILRKQFEVNFFSATALAQKFAKNLINEKKHGRIVFISSIGGLMTPPMAGAYCASKHALEAVAESFRLELEDFNISVATINPGPYNTGFNDRIMESAKNWANAENDCKNNADLQFELEQFSQEKDIAPMCDVIADSGSKFRNVFPAEYEDIIKEKQIEDWKI